MKTAVVICPGRGTYTKTELGSLVPGFPDPALLDAFDARRTALGQPTLRDLDGAKRYAVAQHTRGDNASALIYAASIGDMLALDRDAVQIVAVTGNSMGWYTALAGAGAVQAQDGFEVVNTMGTLMQSALIGGQLIYPVTGPDWVHDPARRADVLALVAEIDGRAGHMLALSIDLGGFLVLAGDEAGLVAFEAVAAPQQGRFPMRLANHAAFHTALQAPVAERGRAALSVDLFRQPELPLIDGRGAIWWPGETERGALWDYTLGHQVTQSYDFTHAVTVAAREFAPDLFIIPGPGTTLGGAVAQSLIAADWRDMGSRADFDAVQAGDPMLISMGRPEQRALVVR